VTNQLGSDERKRLFRISGEILAVERAQEEKFLIFLQINNNIARIFLDRAIPFYSYA
jgi:hypothetical protein